MIFGTTDKSLGHGHAKFEGHVESGQILVSFTSTTREFVDGVPAIEDGPRDAGQAGFRDVPAFEGAARHEPATHGCEDNRVEQRGVLSIEWTIDEHGLRRLKGQLPLAEARPAGRPGSHP